MFKRTAQLLLLVLAMAWLLSPIEGARTRVQAAPDAPAYSYSISPTSASTSTYRVTLSITDIYGVTPPSSTWYGPGGGSVSQACVSGQMVREYIYSSGMLAMVKDYFYISPCSRDMGTYTVWVGSDYAGSFSITDSTDPSITVTAPNGGETWEATSNHDITWTASDDVGVDHVALLYSTDGGGSWTEIIASTANDGVYDWTLPNDPTTTALVRATAYDAAGNSSADSSDSTFSIIIPDVTDPSVTVTAPNGGETWEATSNHDITWTATDDIGVDHVALHYSTDDGSSWTEIIASTANDGVYDWTVPAVESTNALIRATAYDGAGNSSADSSNNTFTIFIPDVTDPSVTVSAPNGGESWSGLSVNDITWTATDNIGVDHVALHYSTDGGSSWTEIIASTANDGIYEWTVPDDPTTTALVRATAYDAAGNSSADSSDSTFTIIETISTFLPLVIWD